LSYKFTIDDQNKILVVTYFGSISYMIASKCRSEGLKIAKENEVKRIIIDIRNAHLEMSIADLYSFESKNHHINTGIKLAYISSEENIEN